MSRLRIRKIGVEIGYDYHVWVSPSKCNGNLPQAIRTKRHLLQLQREQRNKRRINE